MRRGYTGKDLALEKAKRYCAYQERSHAEVKQKLFGFGLYPSEIGELLSVLIEEGFLNEERFARAFAGGKFRVKAWGRVRIRHELRGKGVSELNIRSGLAEIGQEEYLQVLEKLALQKWESLQKGGDSGIALFHKATAHLLRKGYEPDLVSAVLRDRKEADAAIQRASGQGKED